MSIEALVTPITARVAALGLPEVAALGVLALLTAVASWMLSFRCC